MSRPCPGPDYGFRASKIKSPAGAFCAQAHVFSRADRLRGVAVVDYVGFQAMLKLMQETDHVWAKISNRFRLSDQGPPYDDITPLALALIETRAERVVWGTNLPHPMLWDHSMPNEADLLDQFMDWASDDATRRQILMTNRETLYGFTQ